MRATWIIPSVCIATAILLVPAASGAEAISAAVAASSVDDVAGNEADHRHEGRGDASAYANCQLAVLVNTIVASLAEAEGLGIVSDDDVIEGGFPRNGALQELPPLTYDNVTADAGCSQVIGPVLVELDTADGWGEPAPQGGGIASLGEALFNGEGGGAAVAIALGATTLENVLQNDFDSESSGGWSAQAVTNCQVLVAMNTLVLAAGSGTATAESSDDDDLNFTEPILLPPQTFNEQEWKYGENELTEATSTCAQTIESITLVIGDVDTIPPES